MIIKEEDAFKKWLSKTLEPLSEADPLALSKYVLALIKKDKPNQDIKSSLMEQLEIFLQSQTKPFVELLFSTLENKNYLNMKSSRSVNYLDFDDTYSTYSNGLGLNESSFTSTYSIQIEKVTEKTSSYSYRSRHRDSKSRSKSREKKPYYKRSYERRRSSSHNRRFHDDHDYRYRESPPMASSSSEKIPENDTKSFENSVYFWSCKPRCNDFDLKGYCMRGDLCPYDHGSNPVVLQDKSLPNVFSFWSSTDKSQINQEQTSLMEYNPNNPSITMCPQNSSALLKQYQNSPKSGVMKKNFNNFTSILLKKIPQEFNTIENIRKHFSKYGTLLNVHVCFQDDPQAALVLFTSHLEAKSAYSSTEPVLNNRFIKVLWYNDSNLVENFTTPAQSTPNKTSYSSSRNMNSKPIISNTNTIQTMKSEKVPNIINDFNSRKFIKIRPGEKKRQEIIELQKLNQNLLEKQLKDQRQLIRLLEKTPSVEQKKDILQTLRNLQENIEKTKGDLCLMINSLAKQNNLVLNHNRELLEKTEKKFLDAELDLMKQHYQGKDTSDLEQRMAFLKKQLDLQKTL